MKIIFVTREGYRLPGARVRCYNLAGELNKSGIETQVLSFSDTLGAKDGENESQLRLRDKLALNARAFRILRESKGAVFFIQRFNYHSFAPYIAGLLGHNRLILDLDDWEMREDPGYYMGFYPSSKAHFLTGAIARSSVFCVAASTFLRDFLLGFNRDVLYLPSGVDTGKFDPALNKVNEGKVVFSWIGTLHKKEYIENIRLALECFRLLRKKYGNIYFNIAAAGIYEAELRELLAGDNDDHVIFDGWVGPDDMPRYLAKIDVGLVPVARVNKFNLSKSPTKLFEYMSMARPSVCTSIGEAANIIKDGDNGFLAGDKEDFMLKMERLINDPGLRSRMGRGARGSVELEYSTAVLGKRLCGALRKAL